jgi:exodeoxyribonuclease VII large subunit
MRGPGRAGTPVSVGRLLALLKESLSRAFSTILVTGEVLDPLLSQNGHLYFRMTDGHSEIRAVMWRREAMKLSQTPRPGDQVSVRARLDLYAPRGDLQLVVMAMMQSGRGEKLEKLARLKQKLKSEGLFDRPRRELPKFAQRIGLVTSIGSAVLHDIYQSVQRRYPSCLLLLSPTAVSGPSAPQELIRALDRLRQKVEVVIIARGGGSFEELLPFSDEALVRAVAQFPHPVVSAVGHGSDVTLLDMVCDHTAPTPTAAAVLVTPDREELERELQQIRRRLGRCLTQRLREQRAVLTKLVSHCQAYHPRTRVGVQRERLERLRAAMIRLEEHRIQIQRKSLSALSRRQLKATPTSKIAFHRENLERLEHRLRTSLQWVLQYQRQDLQNLQGRLSASGPKAILDRGFALVQSAQGLVTNCRGRTPGEELELQFADGRLVVEVKRVLPALNL